MALSSSRVKVEIDFGGVEDTATATMIETLANGETRTSRGEIPLMMDMVLTEVIGELDRSGVLQPVVVTGPSTFTAR